jgi:dolichol-phosphate mannosyltransferase
MPVKAMVVVPTYNESENIEKLTERVLAQDPGLSVLIVDDNSPDGTGRLADRLAATSDRIRVMHRAGKLGLGSAYRAGFKYALDHGADYIIEMDADFSHDPEMLPVFLEEIKSHDVVVGSRYLHGVSVVNWPLRRLMLSYGASVYTRLITGMKLSDCTGGFKCFRRKVLEAIDIDRIKSEGYSFQIEMNFRCLEKGFTIGEVPIIFIDRHAGTSKMSKQIVREAVVMVWKLKFGSLVRSLYSSVSGR